jgi:hypothetical protein
MDTTTAAPAATTLVLTLGEFIRQYTDHGTDLGREVAKVYVGRNVVGHLRRHDGRPGVFASSTAGSLTTEWAADSILGLAKVADAAGL